MEMLGSPSTFGVGELGVIVHKYLEADGRTMAHFFIFEAVIIMSMGPDDVRGLLVISIRALCMGAASDLIHKDFSQEKWHIEGSGYRLIISLLV